MQGERGYFILLKTFIFVFCMYVWVRVPDSLELELDIYKLPCGWRELKPVLWKSHLPSPQKGFILNDSSRL